MKKWMVVLVVIGFCATVVSAESGLGVFGSYWKTKDLGSSFGGGVKFRAELTEGLCLELRASCLTKFDDWDGDDELFAIPLEGGLVYSFPLGYDSPVFAYVGGGAGYTILPEADEIDMGDDFCFYGLGGIEFALNDNLRIFGEGMYRFLEVDGVKVDGLRVNLGGEKAKLSGLGVNIGLSMLF